MSGGEIVGLICAAFAIGVLTAAALLAIFDRRLP